MKALRDFRYLFSRVKDWSYRNRVRRFVVSWTPLRSFGIRGVRMGSTIDHSHRSYALYEPFLVEKIMEVVSHRDRIYDIGADLGYYSALFSEVIGSHYIVAFEPDPRASYWLKKNVSRTVRCVEKYVGNPILGENHESAIHLDDFIEGHEWRRRPTVLKIDVEGAEVPILMESKFVESERPRLFLEIHPTEIQQDWGGGLDAFFKKLLSLYSIEMVRNHWGIVKTKGPLSVVDQPGATEWHETSFEELIRVSNEIIDQRVQPLCFALHCFVSLEDRLKKI